MNLDIFNKCKINNIKLNYKLFYDIAKEIVQQH